MKTALFAVVLLLAGSAAARPTEDAPQLSEPELEVDIVGDVDGTHPAPQKALQDTIWIAEWTFDTGAPCSETGWEHVDGHMLNDGTIWWHIETGFTTTTGMTGRSAAVGYHDKACCSDPDGYDNDWYQGIRMTYTGSATLSFDYILDSEQYYDLLQIETDSLCLSYARVDFNVAPKKGPANYRTLEASADGFVLNGVFGAMPYFGVRADFGTGSGPRSIAIGDLNGDGKLDLALANSSSNTVSVLLGNGDGTFRARADFGTGSEPRSVAIGDLNGDWKLDLAVANYSSNTVSVLLGNGDGTFRARADFRTGNYPTSVAIADLNGDRKLDLAVANASANTVSVLLGNGDGTFGPKADFGTGFGPRSVAIGDLNGDGKPELAVANDGSNTVSVLLGNGDGTFRAKADFGTGSDPSSVAIGDLNRDGKLDLAVANASANTVSVLLGNGDGTFEAKADFLTGRYPDSVAIGDLNADGKLDLAVANFNSNTVSVLLGNGDGTFEAKADFLTGSYPHSVAIGDLNADGKLDLAVANGGSGTVSVLIGGDFAGMPLTNYGPGTHCVYIAFFSNGGYSPCDGDQPTTVGEGAVVDNIVLVDDSGTRIEDFEDGSLDIGTFLNMADSKPFGTWARLYEHVTDNDFCGENKTCAWLWTDHSTPTLYNDYSMSFGPGGYVVKNWLDDIIVSPWVSLASTPTSAGTVIAFRRFPGNNYNTGMIVQNWSVRGKRTLAGQTCVSGWGHASSWNSLSQFVWQSLREDMSPYFDHTSEFIQIRHRTSDWQWIANASPPQPFIPGPGPYVDRTRIGRVIRSGPVISEGIDSRSQGQDCFPTEIHPGVTPAGQHFRPTTDRFGSCAFSEGTEVGYRHIVNLITGDSVNVNVQGLRPGGTIVTSITWSGAIIAGPHQGKAPPPYTVGANGFFTFNADSVRSSAGSVLANYYFTDLDDFYFRGGDVLVYFWAATDNGGGFTSDPTGMAGVPESVAAAQTATHGLFEVNFLPVNNWAPAYLARIAAHPSGKLESTAEERAASSQKNCILYVQNINSRRMSGDLNRTSFMYALDRLGYRDAYDVYDHQGMGATNNQIGGRATIQQCQGYNLIVYDNGNGSPGRPLLPRGGFPYDSQKIDQATWFRNWLAQATSSEAGFATLWILGSNTCQEVPTNALITTTMGVSFVTGDQALNVNPNVDGVASFAFDTGTGASAVDFTSDAWVLNGGCPTVRNYDAIAANGTAVATHRYKCPITGTLGGGAMVMNRNDAENWNTIMMTFPFFDIRDDPGTPAAPQLAFLEEILGATLPPDRQKSPNPTGSGENAALDVPPRTALHQNVPNPFNPTTRIRFDLARGGKVRLRIYDVAGRLVRTLVDDEMPAGWNHVVVWNGLDDRDREIASGVYFYRLEAPDAELNRKLVVLR